MLKVVSVKGRSKLIKCGAISIDIFCSIGFSGANQTLHVQFERRCRNQQFQNGEFYVFNDTVRMDLRGMISFGGEIWSSMLKMNR